MKKAQEPKPCHPMVKEIIEEELEARGWSDAPQVISELARTSRHNVERLLQFERRLTHVECWTMDEAFGLSAGFFMRLQRICEKQYPNIEPGRARVAPGVGNALR